MRPTIPLVLLAIVSISAPAFAQGNQGAPPPDSGHGEGWVFNQLFADNTYSDNYATVVLMADVAYRLELRPIGPSLPPHDVSLRYLDQSNLPPLSLTPLSDPPVATGGEAFELRPVASGVYRIDVKTEDWLDVRIVRDQHETERWARMSAGGRHSSGTMSGLTVRGVWIGGFSSPAPAVGFPPPPTPPAEPGRTSGVGAELCLNVSPRVTWMGHRMAGCALTGAWFIRSGTPSVLAVGTAPRFMLSGDGRSTSAFAALTMGVGTTMAQGDGMYSMLGPGAGVQSRVASHLLADLEVDALWVYAFDLKKRNALAPKVGFGLHYLF